MDTSATKEENNNHFSSEQEDNETVFDGGSESEEHRVRANGKQFGGEAPSDDDGCILSWGCGEFGQHGHGNTDNVGAQDSLMRHFYERTAKRKGTGEIASSGLTFKALRTFACGASHTVVVTDSDEIYTWGNGNSGQLGCGDKETHLNPQRVRLPSEGRGLPIKGIACGSRHSVLWLENGLCFSWGNNFYAQLGYDFRIENYKDNQAARQFLSQHLASKHICDEVLPHLLRPIAHIKIKQVACGEKHSMFLSDTGVVATCGCSSFGQLGSGSRAELVSPIALESPEEVVFIACGANHSLAVTAEGELFAWGFGRACGNRRQDVLQPVRRMTRQCNVIAAGGGSAHSVALTANGTVYTWGGGTEGQLGHGSKVLYLNDPRPLSHDALPRVSQVACGDSYTAAITSDGSLYMWGKSSHVIPTPGKPDPSSVLTTPEQVSPGGRRVARVACGSWHAMAVVGTPEWLPLEDDSEEEEGKEREDDGDSSDEMESESRAVLPGDTYMYMDSGSVVQKSALEESFDRKPTSTGQGNYSVRREATKLTLAEFYAPTPLPTISPVEEFPDETDSEQEEEVQEEDQGEQGAEAVLNPGEEEMAVLEFQGEDNTVEEMDSVAVVEQEQEEPLASQGPLSFFVDISGPPVNEPVPEVETSVKLQPKAAEEESQPRTGHRKTRPRESNMVRSKTMPVVTRTPLKMTAASTTTAFDWSEPPKPSVENEPTRDRFIIHKHVSVQMNRKGNGAGDKGKEMTPVMKVGLQGSGEGSNPLSRPKDKNVMPQPPKFNRAKTYYGRMNHGKRIDLEPRMSQFLSTLPPAPSQASSAPVKMQTRQRAALEKPSGVSDRLPAGSKPSLDLAPTVSELRGRVPGKPVFSSASSWRTRSKNGDAL